MNRNAWGWLFIAAPFIWIITAIVWPAGLLWLLGGTLVLAAIVRAAT